MCSAPRHRVTGRSLVALIRLRKRVRRRNKAGKPVGTGLGVNLGGRNIRMAQKRLQAAKVGAAIQHMGCETVPDT